MGLLAARASLVPLSPWRTPLCLGTPTSELAVQALSPAHASSPLPPCPASLEFFLERLPLHPAFPRLAPSCMRLQPAAACTSPAASAWLAWCLLGSLGACGHRRAWAMCCSCLALRDLLAPTMTCTGVQPVRLQQARFGLRPAEQLPGVRRHLVWAPSPVHEERVKG